MDFIFVTGGVGLSSSYAYKISGRLLIPMHSTTGHNNRIVGLEAHCLRRQWGQKEWIWWKTIDLSFSLGHRASLFESSTGPVGKVSESRFLLFSPLVFVFRNLDSDTVWMELLFASPKLERLITACGGAPANRSCIISPASGKHGRLFEFSQTSAGQFFL